MESKEIKKLRADLGMNQDSFATLLGTHGLTVSKWERGVLTPNNWDRLFMNAFQDAVNRDPDLKTDNISLMILDGGVLMTIHHLLDKIYGNEE